MVILQANMPRSTCTLYASCGIIIFPLPDAVVGKGLPERVKKEKRRSRKEESVGEVCVVRKKEYKWR
jgi:hypothetical protein